MKLEDSRALQLGAAQLEAKCVELFARTRDAVVAQRVTPRPPRAPAPPQAEPQAPHFGFQTPAPPNAPRLEAEILDPVRARLELQRHIDRIRAFSTHLHNASRLAAGIADLLEHGTVRGGNAAR